MTKQPCWAQGRRDELMKSLLSAALLLLAASAASADTPTSGWRELDFTPLRWYAGKDEHLRNPMIVSNQLVMRAPGDKLIGIELGTGEATSFNMPASLVSAAADDSGHAWELMGEWLSGNLYVATSDLQHDFYSSKWKVSPPLPFDTAKKQNEEDGDSPIAVAAGYGKTYVLTRKWLFSISLGGTWSSTRISPALDLLETTRHVALINENRFWLGLDNGEWDGKLINVELDSGKTHDWSDMNANAVVADPSGQGCILASGGLLHFLSSGELVRVCGEKTQTLYKGEQPIWGLVNSGKEVFAVVDGGMVPVRGSGLVMDEKSDFSKPVSMLADIPAQTAGRFLLVYSAARWEVSLSGMTPYVVALPDGVRPKLEPMPSGQAGD
ncbi:MAG: hypothetical protein QM719_04530 [Thermomonas sp.]